MDSILQGFRLSLAGILITFVYFGLLILVMVLLREIFKVHPQDIEPEAQKTDQEKDRMKAAGIAVAVALQVAKKQQGKNLGQVLETPPGRWWKDARHRG